MSRKGPSFGQLLAYITVQEHVGPAIAHNLAAEPGDVLAVYREFLDNYRYLPVRKNGNVLYHEILSFSDLDQPKLTPTILEDLCRQYLELRAPLALAYGQAHLETGCPHVHIMISANNRESTRRVSLSRRQFATVKRDLEQYQKTHYPFLEHSVVFDHAKQQKSDGVRRSRNESERARRLLKQDRREPSRKEQIRDLIGEQIIAARSAKSFMMRLKVLSFALYQRGKQFGVQDLAADSESPLSNRRYRLSTLGLEDAFRNALENWKVRPERLLVLQEQDLERVRQLWQQQGVRAQILDVFALHSSELSPLERERLEAVHSLRAVQKDRDPPELSL